MSLRSRRRLILSSNRPERSLVNSRSETNPEPPPEIISNSSNQKERLRNKRRYHLRSGDRRRTNARLAWSAIELFTSDPRRSKNFISRSLLTISTRIFFPEIIFLFPGNRQGHGLKSPRPKDCLRFKFQTTQFCGDGRSLHLNALNGYYSIDRISSTSAANSPLSSTYAVSNVANDQVGKPFILPRPRRRSRSRRMPELGRSFFWSHGGSAVIECATGTDGDVSN